MKRIRETRQDNKNLPQNGTQLTVEKRLQIIANLIVDRLLEQQNKVNPFVNTVIWPVEETFSFVGC